jgi:hypothetical protein
MSDATDGLGYGQRVPDLQRHEADGVGRYLYDLVDGRPLLLAALATTDATALAAARDALAAVGAEAKVVALVPLPPSGLARLGLRSSGDLTILADDGAIVGWLRGRAAPAGALTLFALDANQRAIERIEVADAALLPDALARALVAVRTPPWSQPGVITSGAPALFVPRVLEPELCQELIRYFEALGGDPSGVLVRRGAEMHYEVDARFKMRRDVERFPPELEARLRRAIEQRVFPEVDKCFAYRATSIEALKLVCYDDAYGGYHRPHRDNVTADVAERRFAMSVNLNAGEYEGGQLRFPEYGAELYQPASGAAVVFSCSLLHEALPVTRGRRYVFLTFLGDARAPGPHLYHAPR